MNSAGLVDRLDGFPVVLRGLVGMVPDEQARFKPPSGAWSILEIVCHLGDEEVDDFRTRLKLTLEDPAAPWPGIDPEGWARDRMYNSQEVAPALERLVRERRESIRWLRSLESPDWAVTVMRPHGPMRAGDLLVSWAAHDALHIRQIAKRMYELAGEDGKPEGYVGRYAGEWGA
jgi:hypothetical protein